MKVQRAWPIKGEPLSQLPRTLLFYSATDVVNCCECSELQTQLMSVGQDFTFYHPSLHSTHANTFSTRFKQNLSKLYLGNSFAHMS